MVPDSSITNMLFCLYRYLALKADPGEKVKVFIYI